MSDVVDGTGAYSVAGDGLAGAIVGSFVGPSLDIATVSVKNGCCEALADDENGKRCCATENTLLCYFWLWKETR